MNILFLGDVVGKTGRNAVIRQIDFLKKKYNADFTIVNGENAAHGKGITSRIYHQFIQCGVDCITLGNHAFSKSELKMEIDQLDVLIRPINMEPTHLGQGYRVFDVMGYKLCIMNVLGKVFMDKAIADPFETVRNVLTNVKADFYFVDFHAEATSEKITMANYFKNDLIGLVGTHTHVQTADEQIIGSLGYITDVGMCGAFESVLGRDTDEVIENFVYKNKTRYTVSENPSMICGVCITVDVLSKKATNIQRIQIRP
ncbi:TIGR00282 family metallophosphoesterase [Erysipelotrichaceae bacterium OH741_COT-311]|nr:TIGR00282 family metallophosphoesterase [Erysipelotrichaceae bacterium OH741_COT-311]